jgi:ATP-dependent RNA helicase SUPV3L1/SUV3
MSKPSVRRSRVPDRSGEPPRITAVLGPTNTGKTHFAIERMLAHRSGMIGLPLRLLAREVYDKIVRLKGAPEVALVTGEERIVPAHPRFHVCTAEAMPLDIECSFLAVDEIQLCADFERGHVFTNRLLHARGEDETMFLGAATMRGAIQRLVPETHFVTRPRFSDLAYTGPKKLTRLPRRSAIVAFSAEDVYGLADLIRSQRGGAAVVMGALSPRTRNAQVALYQSGEVDFLIATDAIGMGINMDVDHVAFSAMEKFDGFATRPLKPDEIGQIAGRAGRYMNDGTFGVTGEAEGLEPDAVSQVENHRYDPVRVLQWRNDVLDFASVDRLLESLEQPPPSRGLMKARPASDHATLMALARDEDLRARASSRSGVHRLWEACQLPDFRKLTPDEHALLVAQIYRHLMDDGVLPDDWIARQIARLDEVGGDVDTLAGRLAQIRTWTYAAHRPQWTRDPAHWQEQTRAIEDRLSDALHERLTQRFIDRRTSKLMRHLRDEEFLELSLDGSGAVALGGEHVGKLEGFRFAPDPRAEGIHGRTLRAAALKGLEGEIERRARALATAGDKHIALSEHAQLWWSGAVVARLAAGPHSLEPKVELAADDILKGQARELVEGRLEAWVEARILRLLGTLIELRDAAGNRDIALPGEARGIAFQLAENLGTLDPKAATLPSDLNAAARVLKRLGVRVGTRSIFLPKLLKPEASALAALLWAVHTRVQKTPSPPAPGLTSFPFDGGMPPGFMAAAGFRVIGPRVVRLDMLERIDGVLEQAARIGRAVDETLPELASLLGCSNDEVMAAARALGWLTQDHKVTAEDGTATARATWRTAKPQRRRPDKAVKPQPPKIDADSPFAGLAVLVGK